MARLFQEVRLAGGGLVAEAEVLAEDVRVGAVREADQAALGGLRELRIARQQPGRDGPRSHGLAAAPTLIAPSTASSGLVMVPLALELLCCEP